VIIRQATYSDAPAIKNLLIQLGYPQMTVDETNQKISTYSQENYALLVIEVDQQVAGFISLHVFDIFHSPGKIGRMSAFCVDEKQRGKGVGKMLLRAAEDYLISKGCSKLEVTSNERRIRTHKFYADCGYIEDSRRFVKYIDKH
jgi:ribosomal protein S18 acetylase RimI-like enzyme